MLPDLESLRCFEAAAVYGNFRVAATKVALSPAAFSGRIKRLEEQLGAQIFVRTTRRVTLTPLGRRLLLQAQRCLLEARRCLDIVRAEGGDTPYEITLGTRYELGLSWLLPSLATLESMRPARTIHLFFGDGQDLVGHTSRGSLDCLVSSTRLITAGLRYVQLHPEDYALVASPRLLGRSPLERPEHARAHVLVDLHGDLPLFRYFIDAQRDGEVWSFLRTRYLGTIAAVREFLLDGGGVAVLPCYFVAEALREGSLVRVMSERPLQTDAFRLIWRAGHPLDEELAQLGEDLRAIPLR